MYRAQWPTLCIILYMYRAQWPTLCIILYMYRAQWPTLCIILYMYRAQWSTLCIILYMYRAQWPTLCIILYMYRAQWPTLVSSNFSYLHFYFQNKSKFSLNIFICHKQDKRIRHKLYNWGCRLRYLHDIHTLTYTEINYI
jgi:hypothetical protein